MEQVVTARLYLMWKRNLRDYKLQVICCVQKSFAKENYVKFVKEKKIGNIFMIPLFLPSVKERGIKENIVSYSKYQFNKDDIYAFGRIIEIDTSAGDLVEIFNYVGGIPDEPSCITNSKLMFSPIHISLAFTKKRWRYIFSDNDYDSNIQSYYGEIKFLLEHELWCGGKKTEISSKEREQFLKSGVDEWIVYPSTEVEERIRTSIKNTEYDFDYYLMQKNRKDEFPAIK